MLPFLVIDHIGKFLESVPVEHPPFQYLLRLVETGRGWVKLAAAYEASGNGKPHYEHIGVLAKTLDHMPRPRNSAIPTMPP